MLEAEIRRIVPLHFGQRLEAGAEGARRACVEGVAGVNIEVLQPQPEMGVGVGGQRQGVLGVKTDRVLPGVVPVDRRFVAVSLPVGGIVRVIVIDADDAVGAETGDLVIGVQARRERPRGQFGVDDLIEAAARVVDDRGVLVLLASPHVDNKLDVVGEPPRHPQRQRDAALQGLVQRRGGAAGIGFQEIQPRALVHQAGPGQPQRLVVEAEFDEHVARFRRVAELATEIALDEIVVVAEPGRLDERAVRAHGKRSGGMGGRDVRFPVWAGAAVRGPQRHVGAGPCRLLRGPFGDDVDDAADGAVAVQHAAGVAADDFDALDAVDGNVGVIDGRQVDVVEPPPVEQDQGVLLADGAETAHVDGGPGAAGAAEQVPVLDAGLQSQEFGQGLGRALLDLFGVDDGNGRPRQPHPDARSGDDGFHRHRRPLPGFVCLAAVLGQRGRGKKGRGRQATDQRCQRNSWRMGERWRAGLFAVPPLYFKVPHDRLRVLECVHGRACDRLSSTRPPTRTLARHHVPANALTGSPRPPPNPNPARLRARSMV